MTTAKPENAATAAAMPDAGLGRWWRVTVDRKSNLKPIRVSLMENLDAAKGRKSLATELNFDRTTADRDSVVKAAETILLRIGSYETVIGEYNTEKVR